MTDVDAKVASPKTKAAPPAQATPAPGGVNGTMPLYSDPRPVHSRTHGDVAVLVGPIDFAFADTAPLVQVTVDEFERAALDYPIVFFGADRQPYAITGLEPGHNLFVTDGTYRADAYVPAYLRRYPFVFARNEGGPSLILCLDHASSRVVPAGTEGAVKLFEGDEVTELTQQALRFCENYEGAQVRTRVLDALLTQYDLLEPKRVHYTPLGGGEPQLLLEFQTIARDKVEALDDEAFLALRKAGALPAIHAQIASQAKWDALAAALRAA